MSKSHLYFYFNDVLVLYKVGRRFPLFIEVMLCEGFAGALGFLFLFLLGP